MGASENNRRPGEILAKAVQRAAAELEVTPQQLGLSLGSEESNLRAFIDPESSEGFRARQFILIFQYLHALMGNDTRAMAHWVKTKNREFTVAPIDKMQTAQGLEKVTAYLESRKS